MTPLRHTCQVALRYIRALLRQPAWVGISLTQPVIWLLLFGALFKRTADIPGFTGGSYIEFLAPGVVVMLALSSAWIGMGFIEDINRGTMDRLLVSPIWRGALNLGSVAQAVLSLVVQSLIVIGLSLAFGAHFHNGIAGVAVLIAVAALLGAVFASLSNGIAVLARQRETLIGIVTMATLPLTFLSTALMQQSLLPDWIRWVAKFNPVNWAAEAGPLGGRDKRRLGIDREPRRLPHAAPARQRRLRHPCLQRLPTLRLRHDERISGVALSVLATKAIC